MMMPSGWKKVGLFDVVSIESMLVDPKKEPYSEMNLIAPDHIQSETGVVLALVPAKEQHAISGKYLVKEGDVVQKGAILIGGYMEGKHTEPRFVHSIRRSTGKSMVYKK